jgi:hypothetical protein
MKANMPGVKPSGAGNNLKPPSGASLLLVGLKSEGTPETSYVYHLGHPIRPTSNTFLSGFGVWVKTDYLSGYYSPLPT